MAGGHRGRKPQLTGRVIGEVSQHESLNCLLYTWESTLIDHIVNLREG